MKKLLLILLMGLNSALFSQITSINNSYIPFSHYGSYLAVLPQEKEGNKDLYILDVSGRRMWDFRGIFKIEVLKNGTPETYEIIATTAKLTIKTKSGLIEIAFDDYNTLRFKGTGVDMRLTQGVFDQSSNAYPIKADSSQWRIIMGAYPNIVFTKLVGKVHVYSKLTIPLDVQNNKKTPQSIIYINQNSKGVFEAAFEQYVSGWKYREYTKSFEQCVDAAQIDFNSFNQKMYPVAPVYQKLSAQAAYLKWASVVMPQGFLTRPAMLCSKNTMAAVWSWDNCFSAMSTSYKNSKLALDQFRVVFDNQSKEGALPDLINDNHWYWGAVKPPVQGFALLNIMKLSADSVRYADFADMYEPMCRFTNYWFNYQDDDHDGIPQYNNSNDSGEDNGSVFEAGFPLESPDLAAYLVFQMDFLSDMADNLGKKSDALMWKNKAQVLLNQLITEFWDGKRFIAKNTFSGKYAERSNSFLNYIPIILGKRLPKNIREKLIEDIKSPNGIVTPYGPASEHVKSPYFIDDGYWRGPVWAPNTYLLVYGLEACGEHELAKEIARRYINNCIKSGFPENFSSLDGRPLKDLGYSWTADVFILLAYQYFK